MRDKSFLQEELAFINRQEPSLKNFISRKLLAWWNRESPEEREERYALNAANLKREAASEISMDRTDALIQELEKSEVGCIIRTLWNIHTFFYPDIPIPRHFEQKIRDTFPKLSMSNIYTFADQVNALQLGFKAETIFLPNEDFIVPGNGKLSEGIRKFSQLNVESLRNKKELNPPYIEVLVLKYGNIMTGHVSVHTGKAVQGPFNENIFDTRKYKQAGYKTVYYIQLVKNEAK